MTNLLLLAQASADAAARVGVGRIVGGEGYVWTSYAIAYGAMALYGLSLWLRRPKGEGRKD